MVVNCNIGTNGYPKKASRFTTVTKLNRTLESFTFVADTRSEGQTV